MIQIDKNRLARFMAEAKLARGQGKGVNGKIDLCINQAVDWITGGAGLTDAPACVDPVIRRFCIVLNDADRFAPFRDELKPFAARIANTNAGEEVSIQRGFICADWSIRTVAPKAFEFWAASVPAKRDEALAWAEKLRAVPVIVDKASALAGREVALSAQEAAMDAAYAPYAAAAVADAGADAAEYAAAAADAYAVEYAGAVADAAAYAGAYAYADAYADAAAAAAARPKAKAFARELWEMSLAHLDRMIRVTEVAA